ncbi:MAG: hypothetical protein KIT72_01450 [Polyangiaceae bacterium]|nr:hypothetical protein [Polyangiaceae bacterium]MCW5789062.1 hypothetical protein [Polyangiaceae bacterium]
MTLPALRHAPLWLALVVAAMGCDLRERTSQCNALSETVTTGVRPIKALLEEEPRLTAGDAPAARYRELATLYEQLAVDLGELTVSDETLSDIKTGYAALYRETATTCHQLATIQAVTDRDPEPALSAAPAAAQGTARDATTPGAALPIPSVALPASAPAFIYSSPSAVPTAAIPPASATPAAAMSAPTDAPPPAITPKRPIAKLTHQASPRGLQATQLNRLVRRQDGLAARVKLHCQQH